MMMNRIKQVGNFLLHPWGDKYDEYAVDKKHPRFRLLMTFLLAIVVLFTALTVGDTVTNKVFGSTQQASPISQSVQQAKQRGCSGPRDCEIQRWAQSKANQFRAGQLGRTPTAIWTQGTHFENVAKAEYRIWQQQHTKLGGASPYYGSPWLRLDDDSWWRTFVDGATCGIHAHLDSCARAVTSPSGVWLRKATAAAATKTLEVSMECSFPTLVGFYAGSLGGPVGSAWGAGAGAATCLWAETRHMRDD